MLRAWLAAMVPFGFGTPIAISPPFQKGKKAIFRLERFIQWNCLISLKWVKKTKEKQETLELTW